MSIRIIGLDEASTIQSGDYVAIDNEVNGSHKFPANKLGDIIGQDIAVGYNPADTYVVGEFCMYDGSLYKCVTAIPTPEAWNPVHWVQVTVGTALYDKVDKVAGKALSQNDFTDALKSKLDGIEAGAEVNPPIDSALSNSSENAVQNKVITGALAEKADKDGTYPDMTVGNLITENYKFDSEPYLFRPSGGRLAPGAGSKEIDTLVGGSLVWNQLVQNGNFADTSIWSIYSVGYATLSISNGVATATVASVPSDGYMLMIQGYSGSPPINGVVGHKYLCAADAKASKSLEITVTNNNGAGGTKTVNVTNWTRIESIGSGTRQMMYFSAYPRYASSVEVGDTFSIKNAIIIDLTAMFGSTIADYIYSLEQATAGAGVAWFRKLFPDVYYSHVASSLQSVNVSQHNTIGFNQWDEEWESGSYSTSTGDKTTDANSIRSKNPIPVLPNTTYYYKAPSAYSPYRRTCFYDANGNFIRYFAGNTNDVFTTPDGCHYITFWTGESLSVKTYNHDICINLHWDGERDGEYEPYEVHEYDLGSVELRGLYELDANNNLVCNGDVRTADGTVTRRYSGYIDLSTLDWSLVSGSTSLFRAVATGIQLTNNTLERTKGFVCTKYPADSQVSVSESNMTDKTMLRSGTNEYLYVKDTAYTDATTFKASLSNQYITYILDTPTTEEVAPFTSPQDVNRWGTEEYVDLRDVPIPVGHDTKYPTDMRQKLDDLPEIPAAPSSPNGTYVLKAIVSGGNVTYSWVSS